MDALPHIISGFGSGCQQAQRQALQQLQLILTALPAQSSALGKNGWAARSTTTDTEAFTRSSTPALFASVTISANTKLFFGAAANPTVGAQSTSSGADGCMTVLEAPHRFIWRSSRGTFPPLASFGMVATSSFSDRDKKEHGDEAHALTVRQQAQGWRDASGGDAESQQQSQQQQLMELSGTWIKDRQRSGSMEEAMNLVRLNGLVRQAVKLVRGLQISQDPDHFTLTVFSFISWFKVKEVYPWTGEECSLKRRDLRRGKALGRVESQEGQVHVRLRWNDPMGGHGSDCFRLINENELHVESCLEIAGRKASYVTVYNRRQDSHSRQQRAASSSSSASDSDSSSSSSEDVPSERSDGEGTK